MALILRRLGLHSKQAIKQQEGYTKGHGISGAEPIEQKVVHARTRLTES